MPAKQDAVPAPQRGSKITLGFGMVSILAHYKPFAETVRPVPGTGMCPKHGPELKQRSLCSGGTPNEHYLENGEKEYGYPHPDDPDRLVVVPAEVFKELEASSANRKGEIEAVVDVDEIDPAYFDKTYLVWPQAGGEEAFDLFAAVLDAEKKAAVVSTIVSKQMQKVVLCWSDELGCVLMHAVHFTQRLRHYEAKLVRDGAKQRAKVNPKALEMAKALFGSLEGEFDAAEVEDKLTVLKNEAIRAIGKGKVYEPKPEPVAEAPVSNIMEALTKSVAQQAAKKKPAKKKSAARKKVAA